MKKQIKALVIAASVAAIAGIGAVSFAAWTGDTKTVSVSSTGGTAVYTAGALSNVETGSAGEKTDVAGKLIPVDQEGALVKDGNVKSWVVVLKTENLNENYKNIKMTVTTDVAGLQWKYSATKVDDPVTATGYATVTGGTAVNILGSAAETDYVDEAASHTYYVYFTISATSPTTDNNKTVSMSFELI